MVDGAGGRDDVLLDHQAAHVVGAVQQRQLADLQTLRDPARLDVGKVVEIQPATACVLRYSNEPAGGMSAMSVCSGWKVQQMNAVKPPVSS